MNKTLLLLAALFGGIFFIFSSLEPQEKTPLIQPLKNKWEKNVPQQQIPEGLAAINAAYCGACHPDHYAEWKTSTHAHAWTDLQFQAELKKKTSPFMCINCHIPLQNQQEYIITGLLDGDIYQPVKKENKHFDKELQKEGITCAACHIRNNAIIGVNEISGAPHKVTRDRAFLSEQLCISCHNANAMISPQLTCSFETGDEWKAGPYFQKKNCINCHLETTNRANAYGSPVRNSHFHRFPGSGIPKTATQESQIFNGLTFHPGKIKSAYNVGDSLHFGLIVRNELAGHKVPTGDPERFVLITFELKNNRGLIQDTLQERIGEKWEWYPKAKKISENNLMPGEERIYTFNPMIKSKGKYSISVRVTKHRMNQEAADYNQLGDEYPLFITIFEENYELIAK